MARPIEATPVLYGGDAERLLRDLENCCSPEEAKRRSDWAHELLRPLREGKPVIIRLEPRKP